MAGIAPESGARWTLGPWSPGGPGVPLPVGGGTDRNPGTSGPDRGLTNRVEVPSE
jgi:hypothetical protein